MSTTPSQSNPYQPPPPEELPSNDGFGDNDECKIHVRFGGGDFNDLLIGILPAVMFIYLPSGIVAALTASLVYGILTFVVCIGMILGVNIWSITISPTGIHFSRLFGSPRFLRWNEIESIQPATRSEVFWRGWVEPRFPPREATHTTSTKGHFRIAWGGKWLYFPPREEAQFVLLVDRFLRE